MTTSNGPEAALDAQIDALAALGDPVRRALFTHVTAATGPVSRDAAAQATGVARSTAAFHLDKLVEEGLLAATFRRLTDRTGPGAGRPAKLYERSARDIAVSLPAREYEFAARLLLDVVVASGTAGVRRLHDAGHAAGVRLAAAAIAAHGQPRGRGAIMTRVVDLLSGFGYAPVEESAALLLRNCPFRALAQESADVVCGMNLELVTGILDGANASSVRADLDPGAGRCCVVLRPAGR